MMNVADYIGSTRPSGRGRDAVPRLQHDPTDLSTINEPARALGLPDDRDQPRPYTQIERPARVPPASRSTTDLPQRASPRQKVSAKRPPATTGPGRAEKKKKKKKGLNRRAHWQSWSKPSTAARRLQALRRPPPIAAASRRRPSASTAPTAPSAPSPRSRGGPTVRARRRVRNSMGSRESHDAVGAPGLRPHAIRQEPTVLGRGAWSYRRRAERTNRP